MTYSAEEYDEMIDRADRARGDDERAQDATDRAAEKADVTDAVLLGALDFLEKVKAEAAVSTGEEER